ncbi:unnamed protein product [Symbiodinium sp. CCMP2592]|nr:unnamed protein product [Symbiodinium sp. CCMP2592]
MTKRRQLLDVMSAENVLALDDEDSELGTGDELDIHSGAGIGLRTVCCTRHAANKVAALLHAAQLEVAEEDFDYYRKSVTSIVSDQGRRSKEMTRAEFQIGDAANVDSSKLKDAFNRKGVPASSSSDRMASANDTDGIFIDGVPAIAIAEAEAAEAAEAAGLGSAWGICLGGARAYVDDRFARSECSTARVCPFCP